MCSLDMFDFENLEVYKQAKTLNKEIFDLLKNNKSIDINIGNQLKRASISIVINIAEGSAKFSNKDRKNFYIISRASVYECVALFDIMLEEENITKEIYDFYYKRFEAISKMLFGLIRNLLD